MKIEEGHVAVVTGAASGIGFKLCEVLARRGVRLVMADINRERLDIAVTESVHSVLPSRSPAMCRKPRISLAYVQKH